jgi:MFS transporter, ACDE family, multidrug resistance protein
VRVKPESSSGSVAPGDSAGAREGSAGPGRPPRPLIFSITVTGVMANTLIAPALPDIIAGLGATTGQAGMLVAAATLPGIVMAPLIGLLADRYGRRTVVVPCLFVFGLSGVAAAFAPDLPTLLACRLLQGVGSAGLINLAVVIIGDHWDGTERARIIGQNSATLTLSIAVLPPLGGVLTDLAGWRASFLPYGIGMVTAVVVARRLPRAEHRDVRIGEQVREAAGFVRSPTVLWALVTGFVVFVLLFGLFLTAMPLYLDEQFGLGASVRGLVMGLPALTSTVLALSIGRLQARFGTARLVLAAWLVFAGAFAVIAGAPVLAVVLLGILAYGAGEGTALPTLQNLVAGAAPASSRGSVVAMWVGAVRAGQTSGPLLAGVMLASVGARATFAAGAGVAAAMALAQAAVVVRAGRRPAPPG